MVLDPAKVREFADRYTNAWCSGDATAVAACYEEDGTSVVNRAAPVSGRAAIAADMQVFFDDFPDLKLHMDDLRSGGDQAIYLWTLEGSLAEWKI